MAVTASARPPTQAVADFAPRDRLVTVGPAKLRLLQVLVVVALVAAWQLSASVFGTDQYTSSPVDVVRQLVDWHRRGVLWDAMWVTFVETVAGFAIGSVAGTIVGLGLGWSRRLGTVLEPLIVLLYAAPKLAIAPLFVLWFGIGISSKALFSALVVFFLVFFTTFQGARQVDRNLLAVARVMGGESRDVWLRVALPQALIWIFGGMRLALPYALIGAVVAEFLAARSGLGFLIRSSSSVFNVAGVYAGIVVLMIFATLLLGLTQLVERRVLRWKATPTLDPEGAA
jgi:NitT/TauT family transport system permease protein